MSTRVRDWVIVVAVVGVAVMVALGVYALVRWAVSAWGTGIPLVDSAVTFAITNVLLLILIRDVSPRLRRRVEERRCRS